MCKRSPRGRGATLVLMAILLTAVPAYSYAQVPAVRKVPEWAKIAAEALGLTVPEIDVQILARRMARAEAEHQEAVLVNAIKNVPVQLPVKSAKFDRGDIDAVVTPLVKDSLDDADVIASIKKITSKDAYKEEVKSALSHQASSKAKSSPTYSFDKSSGTFSVTLKTNIGDVRASINLYKVAAKAAVALVRKRK